MTQYFTAEYLEKIKKELDYLKGVKTKEIAELLKHTASFGDLKENAAYDDAKERQMFLHMRIKELEKLIANAKVVKKNNKNKIDIGSIVTILLNGKKEIFEIVAPGEANILKNKISYESPLGKEMFGKEIGEKFIYKIEDKKIECEILTIK